MPNIIWSMLFRFLLFIFLCNASMLMSQNVSLKEKVERIDSLMDKYFSNYEQANLEADALYKLLTTKYTAKEYKGYKVDVMLQKSILHSLNGDHHKALQIALEALDDAEKYRLPERTYRSCWIIAIMYENGDQYPTCRKYLDKAYEIYKKHNLENIYSVYCIRMSSYYVRINKKDSAIHYAYKGLDFANKYNNKREKRDAYLLLGGILSKNKLTYREAINYKSLASKKFLEIEDFTSAASQLTDISFILLHHNQLDEAFTYSDFAIAVLKGKKNYINPRIYELRSLLFEKKGQTDSAYYYYKKYHKILLSEKDKMETSEIKKISEKYQNDKKESVIKSKNQQMILIGSLLAIIILGSILLYRKNRQISKQNKIIGKQLGELTKTLEQKQVLLSELQHRVKNNLQHVISILEIQKESVDFNNIDELIRGNQNRIHSMALLHKKLNVAENVNEIDLYQYITDLSELVKESYENNHKKINLNIVCNIDNISIEKALPIGLIIVELVSNSMKHAFKKRNIGIINIEVIKDKISLKNKIYYADNGDGFDFNKTNDKGLGIEIIKGLIDQLDGIADTNNNNGFELTIIFN